MPTTPSRPKLLNLNNPDTSGWSIRIQGYSIQFRDSYPMFKNRLTYTKQEVAWAQADALKALMLHVGEEAIKRCPHFSGELEKAIQVSAPDDYTSLSDNARLRYALGISSSWDSPYRLVIAASSSRPAIYANAHGSQLARLIHYYYDFLVTPDDTPRAWRRKLRKEAANGGVTVGSGFLTRAWTESMDKLSVRYKRAFLESYKVAWKAHGKSMTEAEINNRLNRYAERFKDKDGDDNGYLG